MDSYTLTTNLLAEATAPASSQPSTTAVPLAAQSAAAADILNPSPNLPQPGPLTADSYSSTSLDATAGHAASRDATQPRNKTPLTSQAGAAAAGSAEEAQAAAMPPLVL